MTGRPSPRPPPLSHTGTLAALGSGGKTGYHTFPSFNCDDIKKPVAEVKKKGVEFTKPVKDVGYGLATCFKVPGNFELRLYQPKYTKNKR